MMNASSGLPPLSQPGNANAEEGLVILDGPNGIAVTMTPDAAAQTGRSLISAAAVASEQAASRETDQGNVPPFQKGNDNGSDSR